MINRDIIDVLEENFIEFASPILCNNLPSIDGMLPVNRKVIWGMHKAKVTPDKPFIKMLRASGYILPYYTFGDMPLANAMKNMGNNSINYTYLLPKGNFGDKQRKDARGASARYIECKLSEYSIDMLKGVNKNAVPMKRNYDNTEDEPIVLPSIIPNILINTSQSIAVGESSKMPSHNLNEVCEAFIEYINTNDIDKTIKHLNGADFGIGGQIINNRTEFEKIYKTGKGSFRLIGKYTYDKKDNSITITEVPYEAYIENIESEIRTKVEKGVFKEILDTHDKTDKNGIGLVVYLRKNTDIDSFILKLRKHTSFEKSFSCNFTILDLDGKTPMLMNLEDIINKWREHRHNCIKNELSYDVDENLKKLNKLYGLKTISKDLDKSITIIRAAKKEKEAIDMLMQEFGLNKEQGEYISTIRLVNINQEWITKQISDIKELENKNKDIKDIINNDKSIDDVIIYQLNDCMKKYGKDRCTTLFNEELTNSQSKAIVEDLLIDNFRCQIQLSKEGYFKKTKLNGLSASTNKLKDGDEVITTLQASNKDEVLFLCEDLNAYRFKLHELKENKLSDLGQYIQNITGSRCLGVTLLNESYKFLLIVYKNNKVAKIDLKSYEGSNKKLAKSLNNPEVIGIYTFEDDAIIDFIVDDGRVKQVNTSEMVTKVSKSTQGISIYTWKNQNIASIKILENN